MVLVVVLTLIVIIFVFVVAFTVSIALRECGAGIEHEKAECDREHPFRSFHFSPHLSVLPPMPKNRAGDMLPPARSKRET